MTEKSLTLLPSQENTNKLAVAIIGQNVGDFIGLCLSSVSETADFIIFIDGGSKDDTGYEVREFCLKNKFEYIYSDAPERAMEIKPKDKLLLHVQRFYDQENIGENGTARNFYLEYLKKHYLGNWCLVVDPDEVLDPKFKIIRETLGTGRLADTEVANLSMVHFVYNLQSEDNSVQRHFTPTRLFRIREHFKYPESEHAVLMSDKYARAAEIGFDTGPVLWHFGYIKNVFDIRKKYLNHLKKSKIHSKKFLRDWYTNHIFGSYPVKPFNLKQLPDILRDFFLLEYLDDMAYFQDRKVLEVKHFIDASHWKDYFKCKTMLECGCGFGMRVYAARTYGIEAYGFDKSNYAISTTPFSVNQSLWEGDITKDQSNFFDKRVHDLVVCYDILEHLKEEELIEALKLIKTYGRNFLFSIPFLGDPNLEKDNTHLIKKPKSWWIDKIEENGIKIKDVPEHFLFRNQLLIGEAK